MTDVHRQLLCSVQWDDERLNRRIMRFRKNRGRCVYAL